MWLPLFLLLVPSLKAHLFCLHVIKITSLNDLVNVDLSKDPILLMDQNQFNPRDIKALHVSCIYGTVFESRQIELNKFLQDFQSLRIPSKQHLALHTELAKEAIAIFENIHRSFDIVFKGQIHRPLPIRSRSLTIISFDFWPNHYYGSSGLIGTDPKLLDILAQKLHFSYRLLPPPLSVNGRTLPNGTLVGVLPDVRI